MPSLTIDQALAQAIGHHQAGRFPDAETLYRQILSRAPANPDALHLLGLLSEEAGQSDQAVALITRAIASRPAPQFYVNLGNILYRQQKYIEAIAAHRQALEIGPRLPEAYRGLADALVMTGQVDEAIRAFKDAIGLRPDFAEAHGNLGAALQNKRDWAGAIEAYQQAAILRPADADLYYRIGLCCYQLQKYDEALAAHRQAAALAPGRADVHNELGNALLCKEDFAAAAGAYRQAIAIAPRNALAHYNLGNALSKLGEMDAAIASYQQALALRPNYSDAENNLAIALKSAGRLSESLECYRRILAYEPAAAAVHGNLVYDLHFHPDYDAAALFAEHQRWNERHAQPLKQWIRPHDNDRSADRRLRIGYVSPDFRDHVVGVNLYPLLSRHDHRQFEIFCYSDVVSPDAMTVELRRHADMWRDIREMSDADAAELIRSDRIDILVDLALHMAGNRLLLFARKPAPVQVTYLGYCSTTGLEAIDYRLSDPHMDPPETDLTCYSEKTVRLPRSYWCYLPGGPAPQVNELPATKNGYVTFGCLNNFGKVSPPALELWGRLMSRVDHCRLILHCHPGSHRDRLREAFSRHGVSSDRLEFVGKQTWPQYLQTYQRMDIALDPFPYGGGITTCDSLWMGVPVITLSGKTPVGRGGRSILFNVGVTELVAYDQEQYVDLAVGLAGDLPRLRSLRSTLRQRMQTSPLMDAPRFAQDVEAAYRHMWKAQCR